MKILVEKINDNPIRLLQRAGYIFQRRDGDQMSFVRPFSRSGFPRFHIYTKVSGFSLEINIHFDQKKETYGKETRHHGEYENEGNLKEEAERLKNILG